jgi:hypothetical protein
MPGVARIRCRVSLVITPNGPGGPAAGRGSAVGKEFNPHAMTFLRGDRPAATSTAQAASGDIDPAGGASGCCRETAVFNLDRPWMAVMAASVLR